MRSWHLIVIASLLSWSSVSAAQSKQEFLHTREVNALLIWRGALWTATSGGIERYDLGTLRRTHHLTQEQGLDSPNVLGLQASNAGLAARTARSECRVTTQAAQCQRTDSPVPRPRRIPGSLGGAPITQRLQDGSRVLIATHGAGVWLRQASERMEQARQLTPANQICTNHVQAMAHFSDQLWLGGFRDGLCVQTKAGFAPVSTPFRFVNALLATQDALYVAANEGLFRTRDAQTFERVPLLSHAPERGVNGLAVALDTLWVTTPTALYSVALAGGHTSVLWTPGGSTAIQGLSARVRERETEIWLASEDRGAIRVRGVAAGGSARKKKQEVEVFDALRGLDSSWVLDVAVDPQGTAYAATLRHGLFSIAPSGQVHKLPLPSEWLLRLGWRAGQLWVGTQDGLVMDPGTSPTTLTLPNHCVHSLLELDHTVWIGTESGTYALTFERAAT